jgi:DNA invertase Pin-like site-specific DNA recombinase
MAEGRFVAYYRVSTARQGRSGLGLEGQQQAVGDYLNGGAWTLLAEFTEVETGKRNDRPQLVAALSACRAHRATLVIAKLDRLARSVHFVSGLMASGVPFIAVDMPNATPFMLHVYAAVAEEEARAISARTRDVKPHLLACFAAGITSQRAIAAELNRRKVAARQGGFWSHVTVAAQLRRLEAA